MTIASLLTVALGIADLILSIQLVCPNGLCGVLTNKLALTYVAVGIWAPIPIFFNGIGSIWIASRPNANNGWLCLLSFFNTVAFAPVIVIVTAQEIVSVLNLIPGPVNISSFPPKAQAMISVEITIAVVGGVLFLHALAVLYLNCCCTRCLQEEMEHTAVAHVGRDVYVSSQPPVVAIGGQTRYPTSAEINRMNIWSAYR